MNTNKKQEQTKTIEQEQDKTILAILQEYEQAKSDRKKCNAYMKRENLIRIANNIHLHAFQMFVKHSDKRGLLTIAKSNSDLFKYYLLPFYKAAGLDFHEHNGQLHVVTYDDTDMNMLQDYQTWALARIEQNKQKQKEQKQKLAKIKTGIKFEQMDKQMLLAIIEQAKQAVAIVKE